MRRAVAAVALALAACAAAGALGVACAREGEPLPQVLVVVDTDVTVPDDPTSARASGTLPLANFVRIEVLSRGTNELACENCRRDLPLDRERLQRHAVSFGVVAPSRPADVRVRVFRFDRVGSNGEPTAGAAIDVRARLAEAGTDVVTQRIVALGDRWGIPSAADAPDDPVTGSPGASLVGTWERALRVPCAGTPRPDGPLHDGERCVPGGAFFRGAAKLPVTTGRGTGPLSETRLAIVSPFYMDRYEYTVGRFLRDGLPPGAEPPLTYDTTDEERSWRAYCTLGAPRADADDLPLGCVTWETAKAICERLGGRLPTETEYEYEASGRGEERAYPWGSTSPISAPPVPPGTEPTACCDGVIFGRDEPGRYPWRTEPGPSECSNPDAPPYGGVRPVRAEAVDFVERAPQPAACEPVRDVSRDGIVGLSGSMEEWAEDFWALSVDPCWSSPGLLVDPVCRDASTVVHPGRGSHTIHGNVWWSYSMYLFARVRSDLDVAPGGLTISTTLGAGFRCVRR